ncbi:MAG: L,D-transpeptidase family protein [Pseudomonadota bacterium]
MFFDEMLSTYQQVQKRIDRMFKRLLRYCGVSGKAAPPPPRARIEFTVVIACIMLCAQPLKASAESLLPLSDTTTGSEFDYIVQPDDFLIKIGARYGVDAHTIARDNAIDYDGLIFPGQHLKINALHIMPERLNEGILINLPQRMLFFFREGNLSRVYPVGLGRRSWPTPSGEFTVRSREINKDWIVPVSIQEEMRREGQIVRTRVPPGPDNPLGKYWLGLSRPGYGIHSTIAPMSIYQFRSHGCIRVHPDDIEALFTEVRIGMPVRIVYRPLLLALRDDGRLFLEAHPDVYRRGEATLETLRATAEAYQLAERIDWPAAEAVIAAQEGVARDVTRSPPP